MYSGTVSISTEKPQHRSAVWSQHDDGNGPPSDRINQIQGNEEAFQEFVRSLHEDEFENMIDGMKAYRKEHIGEKEIQELSVLPYHIGHQFGILRVLF